MPDSPVTADLHETSDVHLSFAAKVTFEQVPAPLDCFPQQSCISLGEIPDSQIRIDA